MLVLSRRVGEEIVIDGRIRLIVLAVNGAVTRLGVEAPACVTVDRKEVHLRRGSAGLQKARKENPLDAPEMKRLQENRFMESEHQLAQNVNSLVYRRFGTLPNLLNAVTDLELDAAERELGVPLPQSYRAFLQSFGSQSSPEYELFGLPRDRLWGDIVLMNHLDSTRPSSCVKFTEDRGGRSYYFDTARMEEGECPVIVQDRAGDTREVARSFLHFLTLAALSAVECVVKV
jgi:carbon storage regulator CsrA